MAKEKANEPGEKRRRSPSVPFIVLDKAFSHAWELHDRAGRNRLRVADAAGVWGLRAKSSATSQTVAALYAYSRRRLHVAGAVKIDHDTHAADQIAQVGCILAARDSRL